MRNNNFPFQLRVTEKGIVFSGEMRYNVLKWVKRGEYYDLQHQKPGYHRHPGQRCHC